MIENNMISDEKIEKRRKEWDAFFSRIENDTYLSYSSNNTESVLARSKQKKYSKYKKSVYKRRRLKKLRRLKKNAKKWRLLHKNVFKKYQFNNEINKFEIITTKGTDESNINSNSGSSLTNVNNKSSDIIANYDLNVQNSPFSGIKSKQFDTESTNCSKEMLSSSCDTINEVKLMKLHKCKQLVVELKKLDYSKNIITKYSNNNINGEKKLNKESQQDINYTVKTHTQLKYDYDKENMKIKTFGSDVNNISEENYSKNIHTNSRLHNTEKEIIISNDLRVKLPLSEKNNSTLNCGNEQQEMFNNEINTTKSYIQEINNSVYSNNKRKINSGFSDTLEQISKKRKTMMLCDFLNQSVTPSSSTKERKRRKTCSSDDVDAKRIEQNDVIILLTIDDILNDTF